jgi:hypothetical protein
MSNQNLVDKWVAIEIRKCPQAMLDRLGYEAVRKLISEEVQINLSHCESDELASKMHAYCKIDTAKVDDYRYRQLSTPLGDLIASIRFVAGDLEKPAVFLIHKDFELSQIDEIKLISRILEKEYALFKPRRIRWHSSKIEEELINSDNSINGDLVYVAGFLDDLKQQALPDNYEKIQLNLADSLKWYDRYESSYEAICEAWPAFLEMAQLESKSTLQDLISRELLYEIEIDGHWAGIIAADKGRESFMSGYYIVEEFLTKEFRGRRYAAAVQRHLIEKMPINSNEMLFGTIHHENMPSYRTALRTGRKPVGMYLFSEI